MRAAKTWDAQKRTMPRGARKHGAKGIGVEPEAQSGACLNGFHLADTAREAPLAAYGTKRRRPKSNDRRFPGETLIMGLRSRPSRRGFNFWAPPRAADGYGRARGRRRRSPGGRRPPGSGAATRTLRPEVPKSCNADRPKKNQQFLGTRIGYRATTPIAAFGKKLDGKRSPSSGINNGRGV